MSKSLCITIQRGEGVSQEQPIPVPQCPYSAPSVCGNSPSPTDEAIGPTDEAIGPTDKAFELTANVLGILGLMMLTLI